MEKKLFISSINSSPAFKGHSLRTNERGEKEYQFYLPVNKKDNVNAEVVLLNQKNGVVTDLTKSLERNNNATIPVWTLPTTSIKDKDLTVAYRFVSNGKVILDSTLKSNDGNYNEATKLSRPALNLPRQMYHLMPDNFNPNNGQIIYDASGKELQRNHFNLFGGTIQGIIEKLSEIKNFGAKRIISTPIFGDDTASNHGYWTVNPYKITSTLGNKNDFKKYGIESFKNGLGWVADGAFANEGIEGIHIQDIIRWGEKSPYLNWFDITDFSLNGLKFGVLPPIGNEAEKHYDFKIVNSPRLYTFDNDGKPSADFGKVNPQYDKTQPTYLQQFDRRLMDENYINSPEMLNSYTKKQLDDVHSIRNYQDSVQLIHYNVDPTAVEEKIKEMKKVKLEGQSSTHSIFRDNLRKWQYFSLEHVDKEGTIRNWVGKKDIFALNYINPEVQDYILGVPKYWTNGQDKTLTTYIAKRLATANDTNAKLSEIQNIAKLFNIDLTAEELKNISEGTYQIQLAPVKGSIKEELKDFPLIASEAPREISSLFSGPAIKNSAKLNKTYEKTIAPLVEDIFKTAYPKAFQNGQLTEEGKNSFRLVSGDIMDYISSYILGNESPAVSFEDGYSKIDLPKDFAKKVFNNIDYGSSTRRESVDKLLNAFEEGAKKLKADARAQSDIKSIIDSSLNNVDFGTIKTAKALISKLEAGLEWRIDASKDIMNLDLINQNKANAEKIWNVATNFWKNFVDTVREFNPKAYVIGEVTCLSDYFKGEGIADRLEKEFIKETGFTTQTNYSYIFNILNRIVHGAPEEAFGGPYHVSISGEGYSLKTELNKFFESGYKDNVIYSHEGVGNHDKPRALHGYAINIADFFGLSDKNKQEVLQTPEFKSLASLIRENKSKIWGKDAKDLSDEDLFYFIKGDDTLFADIEIKNGLLSKPLGKNLFAEYRASLESIKNQIKDRNGINAVREALTESLNSTSKNLGLSVEQKTTIETAINDYSKGIISKTAKEHFKVRPYNLVIQDVIEKANLGLDKNQTERVIATIHNEMLKPALSKYKAMLGILVALPGNPTIYAGDEFGETGFETPGNNVYQHNRNQIHRNWLGDSNRKDITTFHDELERTFNLRNQSYFEPFVNGDTVVLDKFAGDNIGGVYRYNQNSDVIAVFNTNGFDNTRAAAKVVPTKVSSIPINASFDLTNAFETNEFVRIGADGKKINDGYYKIVNNTLKRFEDANFAKESKEINLGDSATYFVRNLKATAEKIAQAVEQGSEKATKIIVKTATEAKKEVISEANNEIKKAANYKELLGKVKGPLAKGALIVAAVSLISGLIVNNKRKINPQTLNRSV